MLKFLAIFFAAWAVFAELNGHRVEAAAILGMGVAMLCTDSLVDAIKKRGA
ncbi:hypothetical protein [Microbacterium sp. 1P06AB]|uniref:hypothetical protein n=1 Tax=Microbacterium sp. 1P06AB TaxID=3132289 RepID=UPI0039A4F281